MYRLVRTFHPGDMGDRHVAPILGQVPVPMTLQVFSSPLWVGYRNGNKAYRIGASAKIVQSFTQNLVHKFMHTPYFLHYNNFKSGAFSYYGYYESPGTVLFD